VANGDVSPLVEQVEIAEQGRFALPVPGWDKTVLIIRKMLGRLYIRIPSRMVADVLKGIEVENLGHWPVDHNGRLKLH